MTVWRCRGLDEEHAHMIRRERIASCPYCGGLWCLECAEQLQMICSSCQHMLHEDKHYGFLLRTIKSRNRFYGTAVIHSNEDIPSVNVAEKKDLIVRI